jgi:hypothetical protein
MHLPALCSIIPYCAGDGNDELIIGIVFTTSTGEDLARKVKYCLQIERSAP